MKLPLCLQPLPGASITASGPPPIVRRQSDARRTTGPPHHEGWGPLLHGTPGEPDSPWSLLGRNHLKTETESTHLFSPCNKRLFCSSHRITEMRDGRGLTSWEGGSCLCIDVRSTADKPGSQGLTHSKQTERVLLAGDAGDEGVSGRCRPSGLRLLVLEG